MKKYWFIIGLCLVLLGTAWLIHTVRDPLPSDSVIAYFAVRTKRGEATLALWLLFLGLGLILADAFLRNPRAERLEREKEILREEVKELLTSAKQSQQELNSYIQQVYGRTGLIGLDVAQLQALKRQIRKRIDAAEK